MKNSEEAIEKVLAGLRNSNAPSGMERRILAAVQDHASARSRWCWPRLRPIWLVTQPSRTAPMSVAWGVALVAIFTLVLAVPAIHRRGHSLAQPKTNSVPLAALPPAASGIVAEVAQPPAPGSNIQPRRKTNTRRASSINHSVALRKMRAASYPAPPLPLTEQEKLLLRLAHKGNPVELAMLNPEMRARQDAESKAEFQRFFGQSTSGDNE